MKKNNSIFLLSSAVLAGPLLFVAKSAAESTTCIDLTQYISQEDRGNDNLSILMDGGDIPNNAPVYFDVPAQFTIPGESLDYCIENITIPNSVGENDCLESQNCWLAVGLMATAPDGDLATESCVSSDGDTSGCYACTCTGSSMSSGIEEDSGSVSQGCGLSSDSQWGMTCHDTTNGRFTWIGTNDTRQESNYSYVEVSVCPESTSGCGVCQDGGLHPSFRIGVQWISDLQEQCFDHPFGCSTTTGLSTSALIGIIVGSVLLLGVIIVSIYYIRTSRK